MMELDRGDTLAFLIFYYDESSLYSTMVQKQTDSLVEVDAFLRELSRAVHGVLVRFVLDHLHPFAALALLMAVLADHVELADPVLEEGQRKKGAKAQAVTCCIDCRETLS